jgi:hypothetical protein
MEWLDLILLTLYVQAFVWYGRLSYVQGVLDRHYTPGSDRVRNVLRAGAMPAQRTSR